MTNLLTSLTSLFTRLKPSTTELYPIKSKEMYSVLSFSTYHEKENTSGIQTFYVLGQKSPKKKINKNSIEIYYLVDKEGLFHHETLPSLIIDFTHKMERCYYYYSHGVLYRKEGAAIESFPLLTQDLYNHCYHQSLTLKKGHLAAGESILPATTKVYSESEFHSYLSNLLTNTYSFSFSGPNAISKSDNFITHKYRIKGKFHREDGPALICYDFDGNISSSYWFLEGLHIPAGEPRYV